MSTSSSPSNDSLEREVQSLEPVDSEAAPACCDASEEATCCEPSAEPACCGSPEPSAAPTSRRGCC